jgi:hypothetical protein
MKFFLPFWLSDHIYSSYDPWDHEWKRKQDIHKYIWQLDWPSLPIDGVLVSRSNIEANKRYAEFFQQNGVYETLGIPSTLPTFGDCGAWGYIHERIPPYDALETLEFYRKLKFTYACTVDHIIFPETFPERFERLEITLRNAEAMIQKWREDPVFYGLNLVGVVQGWDPQSYYDSAKEILDMGFKFIALGGQSRAPSRFTIDVLKKCYPLWRGSNTKVHIFGLARWNLFDAFRKYRVYSFDNAYHRRAWLSTSSNYELGDEHYTAIRIPIAKDDLARIAERRVLGNLRDVDKKVMPVSTFLRSLSEYDPSRCQLLAEEYRRTLLGRPWEKCDCIICQKLGIHVIIFRSNERNMRRGFHNLWNLYQRLRSDHLTRDEEELLAPMIQP